MASLIKEKPHDASGETQFADAAPTVGQVTNSNWKGKISYFKSCITTKEGWLGDYVSWNSRSQYSWQGRLRLGL